MIFFLPKSAAETNYARTEIIKQTNQIDPAISRPATAASSTIPSGITGNKTKSVGTDLKSDPGDAEKIRAYLETISSPLAPYADELAKSDFWALLIGICTIEQYNCNRAPAWNYWGMMKPGGGLMQFDSAEEAITYMDGYFTKLYQTRQTVESLRGYYCASECTNWEPTVLRIKRLLESK